jgi:hypothetical protein
MIGGIIGHNFEDTLSPTLVYTSPVISEKIFEKKLRRRTPRDSENLCDTSCALTGTSQFLLIPLANVLTYILANHVPAFTVSAYKMQFITMKFSMKFLNLI